MFIKTVIRLSFIQTLTTALHVLFGLSLAFFFGASPEMDAYVVASNFIIQLNLLFVKAQKKSFIPFIAEYKNDSSLCKDIIASIMRFNVIIFTLLSIAIFVLSDWIAYILAPGLSGELHKIASKILKILSFFIFLSNITAIVVGIIEYNLKFEKAAILSFLQSILLIGALFICERFIGIYSAPMAHIVSLLIITIVFLFYYLKSGNHFNSTLKFYNNYLKKYIHLLMPVILASFFIWLIRFADVFIASFLPSGSISYLSYCQRITKHMSGITTAICIIYFPILSKLNEKKDDVEFINTFYYGLQMQFTITLFISIFIIAFRNPIITFLFERGKFLSSDTEVVSQLLVYYFFVLLLAPMGTYLANAYFCRQRPKLATLFSIISSMVNIILNIILGYFYGIFGLAAASSIAFITGYAFQISNIRRVNPEYRLKTALEKMLNPLIAGIVTLCIIYLLKIAVHVDIPANILGQFTYICISFIIYLSLFFLLCFLLRVEVAVEIVDKAKIKFRLSK